jgi:hypothetical protein
VSSTDPPYCPRIESRLNERSGGDGHGGPDRQTSVATELKVVRRTYTGRVARFVGYGTVPPGQPKLGFRCSGMTATSAPA